MESKGRTRIAVVGSGLAGLTTAWLLATDPKRRFDVEVYESVSRFPSLSSFMRSVTSTAKLSFLGRSLCHSRI